jgi:hypothetical protein
MRPGQIKGSLLFWLFLMIDMSSSCFFPLDEMSCLFWVSFSVGRISAGLAWKWA